MLPIYPCPPAFSAIFQGNSMAVPSTHRLRYPGGFSRLRSIVALSAVICAAAIPGSALAQAEFGLWTGINSSPLRYITPGGIGFGGTGVYQVIPGWGVQASIGAMMSGFFGEEYELVAPSKGKVFQAMAVPVELCARFRANRRTVDGSFIARFGLSGTYFNRRDLAVQRENNPPEMLPGTTGFSIGGVFGVGVESAQIIEDRGRFFADLAASMGFLGREDQGKQFNYLTLRAGFVMGFTRYD